MMSQTLKKARVFELQAERQIKDTERPAFHLSPRVGWMNDPNGFSYYGGKYHLFYQYHPYSCYWGPMHWGHAVSSNLLHWEYLPAAIAPDESYDCAGCFSGTALTMPDGRQLLMYTGVRDERQADNTLRGIQVQCLAYGDGIEYEKYAGNPVITAADLPEGASRFDFRDPKIWRKPDGSYACVAVNAAESPEGPLGNVMLFESTEGLNWHYVTTLAQNDGSFGKIWECPDFFSIDGVQALIFSPTEMQARGYEYNCGNGTVCMLGSYDEEQHIFIPLSDQAVDHGVDYYAPQTIETPDGRRLMIGWMQNWACAQNHGPERKLFGQMALPREIWVQDGRLYQMPVRELAVLRSNEVSYSDICFEGELELDGVKGRIADLEVEVSGAYHSFEIRVARKEDCYTFLCFDPHTGVLEADRRYSGTRNGLINQCRCQVQGRELLKLRVVLDRYSMEVFANDGERAMTLTFETELSADAITFAADGQVHMNVKKYDLDV